MARIVNPVLFSTYYGIRSSLLDAAGLIDPFIDVDTEQFIDPVLLEKSSDSRICVGAVNAFRDHFENYIRLLTISARQGDAAWRGADAEA